MTEKVFLPFWNLLTVIFMYHILLEGLKKLGLVKSK